MRRFLLAVTFYVIFGIPCAGAATLASWEMTPNGPRDGGLRLLSGGDGVVAYTQRGGSRCASNAVGSSFLYFQTSAGWRDVRENESRGTLYAVIEYYDESLGGALTVQYDSATGDSLAARYRAPTATAGGAGLGRRMWKTAMVEMRDSHFGQRQNLGADFRLGGIPLFIRKVVVMDSRPAGWEALAKETTQVAPAVPIAPGGELIVGGMDPRGADDAAARLRLLEENIPAMRRLGVTSYESYVRWNLCEVAPGKFDWRIYDAYVDALQKNGLKWVPFLIAGPAYTLPNWYYKGPEDQGYVCLEHGRESDIQSLWNPAMRRHVSAFVRAFAERYRDSGVIESVMVGITGNYGEAIYPASPNNWTAETHGPYHTHLGYWAGDRYAESDFRRRLTAQYGTIARLNAAWGTKYSRFESIRTFLPDAEAHSRRARLDLINWYTGSMNDYARFWMAEARRNFPNETVYLCTGGAAPPEHGSDFAEQAKIAAAVHGGVRITNEESDYALNFALTRWVASGGQQYGAVYSFEPGNRVSENGVVARIYNATASGAKGLHYYADNLFQSAAASNGFVRYGALFRQRKPVVEVAVYYPQTDIKLNGQRFIAPQKALRDYLDFNVVSDNQIEDGGLKPYKALVLLHGTVAEAATWRRIADWVRAGGLLITADGLGRLETVEGQDAALMPLIENPGAAGRGRVVVFPGSPGAGYNAFLTTTLQDAPELSGAARAAITADGKPDGVFVSLSEPAVLLWLNTTDAPVTRGGVTIPAHGIAEGRAAG